MSVVLAPFKRLISHAKAVFYATYLLIFFSSTSKNTAAVENSVNSSY